MKRFAFLLFFAFVSIALRAQEISPLASFEFGSPLFFNRDAGVLNQFGGDSSGTSTCFSYGIGADLRWSRLIQNFGVASNLQFVYSTGRFDFTQGATVSGIDRKLRFELTALESQNAFSFRAGLWGASRLSANVFEHDGRGNNITPSNPTSAAFHAGPIIAADYEFGNLRASLFGNYDVTANAGAHGLSAGLSLSYLFRGSGSDEPTIASQTTQKKLTRIEFTVNDTPHYQNPPVEKVENHVHDYAMQPDTILYKEWIEESYHLPRIRLRVFTEDTVFVVVTANEALINRYRAHSDMSYTMNDLSALDIHKTNRIIAHVENGSAADTVILPDISSNTSHGLIGQNEYRFHIRDNDPARFNLLLDTMRSLLPSVKEIIVRTPHGDTWTALTQKIRSELGDRVKRQSAYHAEELVVIMSD